MGDAMSELVRTFRDFIYRDALYVAGGSLVLFSSAYIFDSLPNRELNSLEIAYLLMASYFLGYAVMELFSILGVVTTGYAKPGSFTNWLIKQWSGSDRTDMPDRKNLALEKLYLLIAKSDLETRNFIHRLINLKQMGATMGPSFILSSLIVSAGQLSKNGSLSNSEIAVSISLLMIGVVFVFTGRMHMVEQVRYMMQVAKEKGISYNVRTITRKKKSSVVSNRK